MSNRSVERKKRQYEKMLSNPELLQARQELKDEFLTAHPRLSDLTEDELNAEMMKHSHEDQKLRRQKLRGHIEAISDGVIAVIITIMLLEIPMPTAHGGYHGFVEAVGVFLVSFVIVANFWLNNHNILAITEEITESITVQNFIFLGLLSIVPLLTKWSMQQRDSFSSLNYGLLLLIILVQQELMSYAISRSHFIKMPKTFRFWRKTWLSRLISVFMLNLVILIIAVIFPIYGHWLFVLIPIVSFFTRIWTRKEEEFRNYGEKQ